MRRTALTAAVAAAIAATSPSPAAPAQPHRQLLLPIADELVVDLFAGGGGASTGIEQAIGRHVDIAVNHDRDAIGMHEINHPQTAHYLSDVWEVDPVVVCNGRPVGLLHASPDCTHHSQAKGGQPRAQEIRSLAWVVPRWAGKVRPRVITLENVGQMIQWSPLIAKRDKATGRVVTLDEVRNPNTDRTEYRVAEPGEIVPRHRQFLVPDKRQLGRNWRHFIQHLRDLGYEVQWRVIVNADLGAHSTRERLYLIARCDGQPIVWPEFTHAKHATKGRKQWRPAHDCIDWSIPGQSIFRDKPLAAPTMRRIAFGTLKYVLESADPFFVPPAHCDQPPRRDNGAAAAMLIQMGYGERAQQAPRALDLRAPLGTVVAGGIKHATAAAFMVQANGGFNETHARDLRQPVSTVTTTGSQQQLITAHLEPVSMQSAQQGVAEYRLSDDDERGALRCASFLMRYHANGGQWADLRDPATTITTRDRLALVTVWLRGEPWVIVDICLRMLTPRELYNAQDFPPQYVIDRTATGKLLTKKAQVRMCGNSVSPLPMRFIVAANFSDHQALRLAA